MAQDRGGGPGQARLDRRRAEEVEWARWAVGRWAGFPVDQSPRPLVLAGSRVLVEHGFKTGEAKLAFIEGAIESAVPVPGAVLEELTRRRGAVGARVARPLLITGADLAEHAFVTDRGPRRVPAWCLTVEDALGAIWVLDHDVSDWRPAAGAGGPPPDLPAPERGPGARVESALMTAR